MTFLDIALTHAALGLYVFPVARDKSTLTHHGYKDASVDPEKIRAWWGPRPLANPGFAPGASDVAVLDVDHGLTDMASFIAWRDRNGIPATYTVRSGSRPEFKVHMYFKGAMRDVGMWELDGCSGQVKSLGGYVLAAGSEALHGEKHDKPGAPYELIDGTLGAFAPTPDVVRNLRKPATAPSNNSKVPKTAWGLPVHESENRTGFLLEQTGAMRNLGCGKDAILARMIELNEDPEIIADPISEERLEQTAANCAKYPVPKPEAIAVIGSSRASEPPAIAMVEELDRALSAVPLPDYPLVVFEGTLYMDFARRAHEGNYVPLEFFIEGAMTYVGAAMSDYLHGSEDGVIPRLYTNFIAPPGIGKGTTFKRIRVIMPPHRLYSVVSDKVMPPPCSALMCSVASENGLNAALLQRPSVILDMEELDLLFEKTGIQGSGGSLMSIIRTCHDDTNPRISTCKGRSEVATVAYLSLLGGMTPALWRKAMEGKDSYGSGLGGRFNLVATNETRIKSSLKRMDVGSLHEVLDARLAVLENSNLTTIPTEAAALHVLDEWWGDNFKGQPHYNRVNMIAHRKALHLAWVRDLPVITPEIMRHALQLAEYLVAVREVYAVTKGEDKTAIGENRVMHILRQITPKAVRGSQIVDLLDGVMSRASVFRALKALVESGEAEAVTLKDKTSCDKPYNVYRARLK